MNIIPNYLRASHLQNIIDSSPCGGRDYTSQRAREMLESLPRHDGQHDQYALCPAQEVGKGEV